MTDATVPPPTPTTPPIIANPYDIHINLTAALLALVLTVIVVHGTKWVIPDALYFSYSKFIYPKETSPFLVGAPPSISREDMCDELAKDKSLADLCKTADESDEESSSPPTKTDDTKTGGSGAKGDQLKPAETPKSENVSTETQTKLEKRADIKVQKAASDAGFYYSLLGYLIRLSIPLLVGILVGRLFGLEGILSASTGAAGAAILLSWPVVVLWDKVVARAFEDYFSQFLMLYTFSTIAFFYVARLGAFIGVKLKDKIKYELSISKIIEAVLIAGATSAAKVFMEHLILRS